MANKRFIPRHSFQTRVTHDTIVFSCVWLMISGLFIFIPPLAAAVPAALVQFMRITHRIVGSIFIIMPIISAISAPEGFKEFVAKYFAKWTPEDKEWMMKFVPYMLAPKKVHMPDQDEVKSGQRVADGMLIIGGIMMGISGAALWIGTTVLPAGSQMLLTMRLIHDIFFLVMVIFVISHFYLGAGVFQPYRGTIKLMFGKGEVGESDGLYHWGFWARKEIEEGNVVTRDEAK